MSNNVLPLHLKQTFPFIISIFTEGEGDGIKSRLPFRILSTLSPSLSECKWIILDLPVFGDQNQIHDLDVQANVL